VPKNFVSSLHNCQTFRKPLYISDFKPLRIDLGSWDGKIFNTVEETVYDYHWRGDARYKRCHLLILRFDLRSSVLQSSWLCDGQIQKETNFLTWFLASFRLSGLSESKKQWLISLFGPRSLFSQDPTFRISGLTLHFSWHYHKPQLIFKGNFKVYMCEQSTMLKKYWLSHCSAFCFLQLPKWYNHRFQ